MATISWPHLIGQAHVKEVFTSAISKSTLGHAYLLCGESGSGTFAAAIDLATAILCLDTFGKPCRTCASCRKITKFAHPDLHFIMPVPFQKDHKKDGKLTDSGWDLIVSTVNERIADPYAIAEHTVTPSIPVEWMRETNHAVLRGAVESDFNVFIIDGIDILNQESANSMLKILEEPPAGTLLLLLTDRLSSVLPTIVSRCQILRFAALAPDEIRAELARRLGVPAGDERITAVAYTGSLGRSLRLWHHPPAGNKANAAAFWTLCQKGEWQELARFIDSIADLDDFSAYENLFAEIIHRARNGFLKATTGALKYFSGDATRIVDLGQLRTPSQVEEIVRLCQNAISAIKVRSNITLVLANFAIAISEELNGKKQQSG